MRQEGYGQLFITLLEGPSTVRVFVFKNILSEITIESLKFTKEYRGPIYPSPGFPQSSILPIYSILSKPGN